MPKKPKTRSPIKDRAAREAVWRYLDRIDKELMRAQNAGIPTPDAFDLSEYAQIVGQRTAIQRITAYLCGDIEREKSR